MLMRQRQHSSVSLSRPTCASSGKNIKNKKMTQKTCPVHRRNLPSAKQSRKVPPNHINTTFSPIRKKSDCTVLLGCWRRCLLWETNCSHLSRTRTEWYCSKKSNAPTRQQLCGAVACWGVTIRMFCRKKFWRHGVFGFSVLPSEVGKTAKRECGWRKSSHPV